MIDAADRNFLIPCSRIFCYIINSERMIDMIVEAINKRTGKTVKIEEAYSGQRLTCPYCGVEVHPAYRIFESTFVVVPVSSTLFQYFHIPIRFCCKVTKNINTNICQTYKFWLSRKFRWGDLKKRCYL